MKTLRTIALLTVLASMLFAAGAQAATIGVYFGPNKLPWKTAAPNQSFDIWVIVKDVQSTIDGVEYKLNLPTQIIITSLGFPDGSIRIGDASEGYAVALGQCVGVFGSDDIVIQNIRAYAFTQFPEFNVTLTAYEGQQQENPTAPRYSNCIGGVIEMDTESGVLVGTTVAVEAASFGSIKALF